MSAATLRPQAVFPPVLFAAGSVAVGYALVREVTAAGPGTGPVRAAAVVAYIAWLVAEARITFAAAPGDGTQDRGTVYLYGLGRVATAGAALLLPSVHGEWSAVQTAGLAVFVTGVAVRLTAIRRLGRFYAHQVRTLDDHRVVDDGPYAWVRHPAYLGMVLAHVGFVIVFLNPWSVLALLGWLVPAVVLRIRVEERVLLALPGYAAYAAGRSRLVPGVW